VRESTNALPEVVLYTRRDCCLCEEAREEIERARASARFVLSVVDVDEHPELAERYGLEVPVVEVDGRKAFKYRLTSGELLRRLAHSRR